MYDDLSALLDSAPEPRRRKPGSEPEGDPYRAFVTDCSVRTMEDGPLAGVTVGVKDNIAVAGIEMTCGSPILKGYVPETDATVVRRILNAGAHVTGKTAMRPLAIGTKGARVDSGPVLNPHDRSRVAGGSSGGSAAAVAAGDVNVALGTDQGGSIRNPASYCGCVGLKLTHGLVPYTGSAGLGPTIDHLGPLTRAVDDCAKLLSVLAGADGDDPRQGTVRTADYTRTIDEISDVRVGVLEEGFGHEAADPRVDETVRSAARMFADLGCDVSTMSVPEHRNGRNVWTAIANEEIVAVFQAGGLSHLGPGLYEPGFVSAMRRESGNSQRRCRRYSSRAWWPGCTCSPSTEVTTMRQPSDVAASSGRRTMRLSRRSTYS
jgi:amidase